MNTTAKRPPPVKIMLSSTVKDLGLYRELASRTIKDVAQEKLVVLAEIAMEHKTSDGEAILEVELSKTWVDEADWVILIVGFNYGHIADIVGAERRSVTEWEYLHARECEDKKIFVFIAGDPFEQGEDAYDPAVSERSQSLVNWALKQSNEQKKKLAEFKQELCYGPDKRLVKHFRNVDHFDELLRQTLANAVDDLALPVQPDGGLAKLFVSMSQAFEDCIDRVEQLADCKEVHDALHDLLHKIIRRIKVEVLPKWREGELLGDDTRRSMNARWSDARECLGRLRSLESSLNERLEPGNLGDGDLLGSIRHLREGLPPIWEAEAKELPDRDEFEDQLDEFVDAVMTAFTIADQKMEREEDKLVDLFEVLFEGIGRAKEAQRLNQAEQAELSEGLNSVKRYKDNLRRILGTHHAWQTAHDTLQVLENYRDNRLFPRKMRNFASNALPGLRSLVKGQMPPAATDRAEARTGGSDGHHEPLAAPAGCDARQLADAEELWSLVVKFETAGHVEGSYEANSVEFEKVVSCFDDMVTLFEEIFYAIDARTRDEVRRYRDRVRNFRRQLNALAKEEPSAA